MRGIEVVEAFDWWDAVALGIVRMAGKPEPYLANLVYWDVNAEVRLYALVPLSDEGVSELVVQSDTLPWPQFVAHAMAVLKGSQRLYLMCAVGERVLGCHEVDPSVLERVTLDGDVDSSFGSERRVLLDSFGGVPEPG